MTGVAEAGNDEFTDQGQMAGEKEGSDIHPSDSEVPKDEIYMCVCVCKLNLKVANSK